MDYSQFKVKQFEHWTVFIHGNQYFLGRTYLWATREDASPDSFFDLEGDELKEFCDIGRNVKAALKELWQPDLVNLSILGNEAPHLHAHLIPRYHSPRTFDGFVFEDKVWGKNPALYDRSCDVPLITKLGVRDILQYALNK